METRMLKEIDMRTEFNSYMMKVSISAASKCFGFDQLINNYLMIQNRLFILKAEDWYADQM
jgi:hypothetical protein